MPTSHFLPGVIYVLSTIVLVTHCCSSRFVLVKERPVDVVVKPQTHFDETLLIKQTDEPLLAERQNQTYRTVESVVIDSSTMSLNKTERSLLDPGPILTAATEAAELALAMKTSESKNPPIHAAEFIQNADIRAQQAGNPDYHVIDCYFKIMRDVLSFECTGQFLTDFCLNNGRCFRYPIGNHSFYSCECADGYVGERCESKSLNDFLVPTTSPRTLDVPSPKILTARIVFSFPMLIALSAIYIGIAAIIVFRCPRKN